MHHVTFQTLVDCRRCDTYARDLSFNSLPTTCLHAHTCEGVSCGFGLSACVEMRLSQFVCLFTVLVCPLAVWLCACVHVCAHRMCLNVSLCGGCVCVCVHVCVSLWVSAKQISNVVRIDSTCRACSHHACASSSRRCGVCCHQWMNGTTLLPFAMARSSMKRHMARPSMRRHMSRQSMRRHMSRQSMFT